MKVVHKIENGPILIAPDIHEDERGYFYESFNDKFFRENVCDTTFVQDNQSKSSYGVLRGMHFQKGEHAQAKLVRVIQGEVIDVVLDIRKDSPNYGKYYTYTLSQENHYQLFVPRGFAHGFISMRDDTIFQYKCDNPYCKESEGSYRYDSFGFDWSTLVNPENMKISSKDQVAIPFTLKDKNTVDIPKNNVIEYIKAISKNDLESFVKGDWMHRPEWPFDNDIYAEIELEDGKTTVVKLIKLSQPMMMARTMSLERLIICKTLNTGLERTLSSTLNEVKRFFKYE